MHGHFARCALVGEPLAKRRGAVEGMGVKTTDQLATASFWQGRRTLVTGATGLIGSWLVQNLLGAGAEVVALIRDADLQSEIYRSRAIERVRVVQGSVEDFGTLGRAVNDFEIQT